MNEKGMIRDEMKQLLQKHENKNQTEYRIISNLINFNIWKNAKAVGITIARKTEWNTSSIIELAWDTGKKVGIPRCTPRTAEMVFYQVTSFDQLENVYLDLFEPDPQKCPEMEHCKIDVMIVPGLVFDLSGHRIGYGGGYYDRYLTKFQGIKIALAAEFQVIDHIHSEAHDIPVDYIVTETAIIDCNIHKKKSSGEN
ncbi:5-formyltetrahydrofolate cyclo-ligase [Gracilibacillus ureilyticus]|uniref:5-formyltetrahydrofolate cyclo-ligase n=1 Tax=Gracilibacillus ureilyticus TaxID=531814 RepID=A0A1H9M0P5_9BACI|nr:5-formyltetrahydrofolate cyclo-ligase [Gracilibacillus ureilyticus]SER17015.1 5-formyltetrahydrofolate cyclo-ligase [Gracilibacillus ureilyticus]